MTQYLISFDNGAMDFPEEELPDVAEAAHAVVQAVKDAGVFVFTGGLDHDAKHAAVAPDGMVTDGPYPESKELIGASSSSTYPPGRLPWNGPQRSRSPAVARKTSASSSHSGGLI